MQYHTYTLGSTPRTLPLHYVSSFSLTLKHRSPSADRGLQCQQPWDRQALTAIPAAAASDGRCIDAQDALAWTFSESPGQLSPSPDTNQTPTAQDQQQQLQQQQQQHQQQQHRRRPPVRKAAPLQQGNLQQQHRHHSRDFDDKTCVPVMDTATRRSSSKGSDNQPEIRPGGHQRPHRHDASNETAPVDLYFEAQQRVRAVLAAADPSNAAAAAELLPDTVNDLTIALQLLATAPRPNTLAEYRQYEAAAARLGEAVLLKYKAMLLRLLPAPSNSSTWEKPSLQQPQQQQQQKQQQQHADDDDDVQARLAAAMASLPATKVAATSFSMGVLKLYDRHMVQALEDASLQLMERGAFKPNQLGQLVQGFVYLDHNLSPQWHDVFLQTSRVGLRSMQAPQVASLSVWLTTSLLRSSHTALHGSASSAIITTSSSELQVHALLQLRAHAEPATAPPTATGAAASPGPAQQTATPAPWHLGSPGAPGLDADWVQGYLQAAGRCAARLTPLQLMQVLQACAALVRATGSSSGQRCPSLPAGLRELALMQGLPLDLSHLGSTQSASSSSRHSGRRRAGSQQPKSRERPQYSGSAGRMRAHDWAASLVSAVQRLMPELSMTHLAGVLPSLTQLTQCPWPQQHLQPLLLQVRLQLPWCAGSELILVTQAVTQMAAPGMLAAEHGWCDAVLTQLHAQFATLGPEDLAGAVRVAALLQTKPYKAWMCAFYQRLRIDGKLLDAGQVVQVLEGLAAIGAVLDPELLHVLVGQIKRWMPVWGSAELLRVADALRAMYPRVLPGRTVHQLVLELQRRCQFLDLAQ